MLPLMMFFRQEGLEEDGWRGSPFWWPVLFVPAAAVPSVFAASVRSESVEGGTEDCDPIPRPPDHL
jgi:hypothetical protein